MRANCASEMPSPSPVTSSTVTGTASRPVRRIVGVTFSASSSFRHATSAKGNVASDVARTSMTVCPRGRNIPFTRTPELVPAKTSLFSPAPDE